MFIDFSSITPHFNKWADFISAMTGFLSAVMLGISGKLIPWGLRLQKKFRHPFKKGRTVNNGSNQSTSNREEWWGSRLRAIGWILLAISFFIQSFIAWPLPKPTEIRLWQIVVGFGK